MACLFRMISARYRHAFFPKKSKKEMVDRFFDKLSYLYGYVGIPVYYLFSPEDNKINLIPSARKYVLVGDETMVKHVRDQIVAEFKKRPLVQHWNGRRDIDIKIINDELQYADLENDKINDISLLLCLTAGTDYANMKYCLPNNLPSTITKKNIIMEHPLEQDTLIKSKQSLKKNEMVEKHFGKKQVIVLLPLIAPIYWSVDNFTKNVLLYGGSQILLRMALKK